MKTTFDYYPEVKSGVSTIITTRPLRLTQDDSLQGDNVYHLPKNHGLLVYADELTISGGLNTGTRPVTIVARTLRWEATKTSGPAIDTSGANGAEPEPAHVPPTEGAAGSAGYNDCIEPVPQPWGIAPGGEGESASKPDSPLHGKPGADGRDAGPAGHAGPIVICCGRASGEEILRVTANGGRGGAGQDGQSGGRGGHGGPGFNACVWVQGVSWKNSTAGGAGGRGGDAGRGGVGGAGGNAATIRLLSANNKNTNTSRIVTEANEGQPGASGKNGAVGAGGEPGKGGGSVVHHYWWAIGDPNGQTAAASPDGARGAPGHPAPEVPSNKAGSRGEVIRPAHANYSDLRAVLVTPSDRGTTLDANVISYFSMLLEHARAHFLSGNTTLAQEILDWINNVYPSPTHPDQKARSNAFVAALIAARKNLRDKKDIFGNGPLDVPTGSVKFYQRELKSMLAVLKTVEDKYGLYLDTQRSDTQRRSDYETAVASKHLLCEKLEAEQKQIKDQILKTMADITTSQSEVNAAKVEVLSKLGKFKSSVNEVFHMPKLEQFAGILMNLSFMPEGQLAKVAMGGSQALTGIADMMSSFSKITLDDGSEVDKQLIISRVDHFGEEIADLSAGYEESQHFLKPDDGAYRILHSIEKFEEVCEKLYNNAPGARDVKKTLDSYVRKITHWNGKIEEYNSLWNRLAENGSARERADIEAHEDELKLARTETPGQPQRVAALASLYARTRDLSLKRLHSMSRAYEFWSLDTIDKFASFCQFEALSTLDHTALSAAYTQLGDDCIAQIDGIQSKLRVGKFPATSDMNVARGITIELAPRDQPGFFAGLITRGLGRIEITPDMEPFRGLANVRVTCVRAWIFGMKNKSGIHQVSIRHTGRDLVYTPARTRVEFQHDPVDVIFRYDAAKGLMNPRSIYDGGGTVDGLILHDDYAPIGPFTTWEIGLPLDGNTGLVSTGIDKVVLEFHGLAQDFDFALLPYSSDPRAGVLDVLFYLRKYPDLQARYGGDLTAAQTHWLTEGIHEGRDSSPTCSAGAYLARYAELAKLFGYEYKRAIEHYITYGIPEKRDASPAGTYMVDERAAQLDPIFYADKYRDLKERYGYKVPLLIRHWLDYGISEKRIPNPSDPRNDDEPEHAEAG